MTAALRLPTTPDEFPLWAERQEARYEFVRGRPVLMVGTSRNHGIVVVNLVTLLRSQIDADRFTLLSLDFLVRVGAHMRAPDLLVEPAGEPGEGRESRAPIVIAEVLSRSTMHIDMIEKAQEYGTLPTVRTYIVAAQDEPRVFVWRRATDGTWPSAPDEPLTTLDDVVDLAEIGASVPLRGIYDRVALTARS